MLPASRPQPPALAGGPPKPPHAWPAAARKQIVPSCRGALGCGHTVDHHQKEHTVDPHALEHVGNAQPRSRPSPLKLEPARALPAAAALELS